MELTSEQIDKLYKFTREHFVEYYDLQTELVDHMANDIEELWKEQPNLSFDEAKNLSFKKFGIFGFSDICEAKQNQMQNKYWKIIWGFLKEWFRLPKITLTISAIILLNYLLKWETYGEYIFCSIVITSTILFTKRSLVLIKKMNLKKKSTGKKWLLDDIVHSGSSTGSVMNIFNLIYLQNYLTIKTESTIITSSIVVIFFLIIYISLYVVPSKSEELLRNEYPEYELV